ncbi:MAG: glycosyltransferase family 4 protein [Pseudomonadota bacterium]|nr:glycosyltransferase family 4 protein [Pseudomonadota bacterium]
MTRKTVLIVVKGYPRLTETFISQEIRGLERRGLQIELVSLRRPTESITHPIHAEIKAPIRYLPEYIHTELSRAFFGWFKARKLGGYRAAIRVFLQDFARDRTRNRIRRFLQACIVANEVGPNISKIYAHFLHTPASVARYASVMRGLPLSLSAHAVDIWTCPDWELAEKINSAEWTTVCSKVGAAKLRSLAKDPSKVFMFYHGLDLEKFRPRKLHVSKNDGTPSNPPARLISVGRTVPKKGFDVLLEALALMPDNLCWEWTHIGDGPYTKTLKNHAKLLGISDHIHWRGVQNSDKVIKALRQADIFVLPCRRDNDGNQDGLPNVLMEAQSQGLAVVSTNISAIPEFIIHSETGILVPPNDPLALQEGLVSLITSPDLRFKFGKAGEERVRMRFDTEQNLDKLARLLSGSSTEKI